MNFDITAAFNILSRYVPDDKQYLKLKHDLGWSDRKCFAYLYDRVSSCKTDFWKPK